MLGATIPKSKLSKDGSSVKSISNPSNSMGLSAIPESEEVSLELGDVMLNMRSLSSGDDGQTFISDVKMSYVWS
jgi:hypothetical protein